MRSMITLSVSFAMVIYISKLSSSSLDAFAHFHALFVRWKVVAVAIAAAKFEFAAISGDGIIAPAWNQCPAKSLTDRQYATFARFHIFQFVADRRITAAATAGRAAGQTSTRVISVRIIAARNRIDQIRHTLQQLFTIVANDFII